MSCSASGGFFVNLCILKDLQDKESRVVLIPVYCFLVDLKFLHYIIIHSFLCLVLVSGMRRMASGVIFSSYWIVMWRYLSLEYWGLLMCMWQGLCSCGNMWNSIASVPIHDIFRLRSACRSSKWKSIQKMYISYCT